MKKPVKKPRKFILHCKVESKHLYYVSVTLLAINGIKTFHRHFEMTNTIEVIGRTKIPREGREYEVTYKLDKEGKFVASSEWTFRIYKKRTSRYGVCCYIPDWWWREEKRFNRTVKFLNKGDKT